MNNPYSAPNAVLSDPILADEVYQPKVFALHGRIGRLRYFAYSSVVLFILSALVGIVAAVVLPLLVANKGLGIGGIVLMVVLYIPIIAFTLIMAKRRFNDLDHSGWLSLLMLVPLLNMFCALYLMFGPGSAGSNRYGARPAKNSVLLIIAGVVFPIIVITGILAAVAIPAYQDFKIRAANAAAQSNR